MSYFDGIQVGDRVWSHDKQKWGTVTGIDHDSSFPIFVNFSDIIDDVIPGDKDGLFLFNPSGRGPRQAGQTLFWDEVKIDPPPRPKRKKKVTKWLNIYFRKDKTMQAFDHCSEADAKAFCDHYNMDIVSGHVMAHPVEVEVEE